MHHLLLLLLPGSALAAPFLDPSPSPFTSDPTRATALADVDGDGDLDALIGTLGGTGYVHLNDGNGQFTVGSSLGAGTRHTIVAEDLDGDGDIDAFLCDWNGAHDVFKNNGAGSFTLHQTVSAGGQCWTAQGADFDGDGDADIHISSRGTNHVLFNDGSGTLTAGPGYASGDFFGAGAADFDGDGDVDVFVGDDAGSWVYKNDGTGTLTVHQSVVHPRQRRLDIGDVDGDGDLDVLGAGDFNENSRLHLNDGNGSFTDSGISFGNAWAATANLADFDGDGDLDALIGNINDMEYAWINVGGGNFVQIDNVGDTGETMTVATGDINGDGLADMVMGNWYGPASTSWINNGSLDVDEPFSLSMSGSCPAGRTVTVTGATPNTFLVALSSPTTGSYVVPSGPCAGTVTGLGAPVTIRLKTWADASGSWQHTLTPPPGACGHYVQFVEGPSCLSTNVDQL